MAGLDRFGSPPGELRPPAAGEIHVWAVPLDPPAAEVAALGRLLAPDEAARAARFRFARHRRRFTVGRGVLRRLLARYLGADPAALAFRYGFKEKPYLAGGSDEPPLWFNLSNSAELAVVAFATGAELGTDLEALRPMPEALAIAERFFSAAERRALERAATAGDDARDRAFFRCWTRKEAYLKAVGTGITVPLAGFDVSLGEDEPPRMLAMQGDPQRARRWTLHHLEPAPGYLGALAVPARPAGAWRLAGWRWG